VLGDWRDGLLSAADADAAYAVVIDEATGAVDHDATDDRRRRNT
jgi:hypothetical protein